MLEICVIEVETVVKLENVKVYLLRANNRNNKARCEICSKLTKKTWRYSGVL